MRPAVSTRRLIGAVVAMAFAVGAALGGYAAGHSTAPTREDAHRASVSAEQRAFVAAYRRADEAAHRRGLAAGRRKGELRGRRLGQRRGLAAGTAEGEERRAEAAAAAEAERQAAIAAQIQERAENCGAPLFVDGYCPTDEEVALEGQAESLCGGGNYEEARAQGIACFPPGDPRNP